MLRLCAVLVLATGCELLDDDCKPDTARCAGDQLQICVAHGGGFYGEPPTYVHSSSPTWQTQNDCGANRCVTETATAFCALASEPDPICAGASGDRCDDQTYTVCAHGYVVAREACTTCGLDILDCQGGLQSACRSDGDCAAGMTCDDNHVCSRACACPDGECAACTDLADWAVGEEGGLAPPVCKAGRCTFL